MEVESNFDQFLVLGSPPFGEKAIEMTERVSSRIMAYRPVFKTGLFTFVLNFCQNPVLATEIQRKCKKLIRNLIVQISVLTLNIECSAPRHNSWA